VAQLLVSVNKLICLVKKKLKLPMRKRREKENIRGFGRNCCAVASTIYYACYTFSNDFTNWRQDPHHSNRMFFLNTVVYDNFVHFQHCELALAHDGKEKKMSQTRDRKRCWTAPLPTNERATLKIAFYVNCVFTKPVCNLKI